MFAYLKLSGNIIGDKGAATISNFLRTNDKIVHVDLASNNISNEGFQLLLDSLCAQNHIVSLDVSSGDSQNNRNRVGAKSAHLLSRYLTNTNILTHLNLSGSILCKEGHFSLSTGLKNNKSLMYLNL